VAAVLAAVTFVEPYWGQGKRVVFGLTFYTVHALSAILIAVGGELALVHLERVEPAVPALLTRLPETPYGVRARAEALWRATLHVADMPAHIYTARAAACSANAMRVSYYWYYALGMTYFWVLATPTAAFIFGVYLALSSLVGRHMDEAFSSLRIPNWKNFLKFHIDAAGRLHMYAVGIEKIPRHWELDPQREADAPSRWRPVGRPTELKLVDYLCLPPLPLRQLAGQK
jgi:hypothetical protein